MNRYIVLILFLLSMMSSIFSNSITLWFEYEGLKQMKEIAKEFEKETGITVNIIQQKRISDKLFTTVRGNGDIPDVILVKNDEIGKLKEANLIENVDDVKSDIENKVLSNSFEAFKVDNRVIDKETGNFIKEAHYYGVPFYFDTQVLYYHDKVFYDYGFPLYEGLTFEDLLFASYVVEDKSKGKIMGLAWGANSPYWFPPFQWAFGKKELMENGRIIINDDETYNAIDFIFKNIAGNSAHLVERQGLISGFKSGKIAAMFFGTFMIPDFIKSGIEFKILPLPYIEEAGNYMTPILDYKGFSIIKGRKTKEVKRFIDFVLSKDSQVEFCENLYKFPINKEAFDKLKEKDEYFKVAYESARIGKIMPTSAYFKSKYWQGVRTMMTLILNQKEGYDGEIVEKAQEFMDGK
ncbi:sugar ABC transporter substrate-binding protein [Marinitoga aeolica]|uniref:Extracellular solute-binding protein n=1 Tax=Marinitoga aeolica TaxID=2809031 RepID=A0ABY8PTJ3_9BACT|nr:extracellular solute-binding protein [Marinitoga aeolica]WGS65828.1 extracellular solute-binding protein [Marinitoga aeolica]